MREERPWHWTRRSSTAFLDRFVSDLGATIAAGNVVVGDRLGLYRGAGGRTGRRPASWPSAPDTDPRYVDGVAARPGGRRLRRPYDAARRRRYSLTAGAGLRAHRPGRPGLPARRLPARARRAARPSRGSSRRSAPATGSAGTSTTRTCSPAASGSSGPATCEPGRRVDPGAGRRRGQAAAGRRGRRRRLRARRVDGADGAGVPGSRGSSARTTTTARSSWPASAPPTPASPTG